MDAKELLKKYKDIKVTEVVRYNPDIYCDVSTIPKWDIPEKTILGVAVCGSFIDKRQNPKQPYTSEEILNEAVGSIESGAKYVHFHVRDEKGGNIGDIESYKKVILPLREKYGMKVMIDGCPVFGKNFEECCSPLTENLFEIGIVNPVCTFVGENVRWLTPQAIVAQCEYFQSLKKKVMVSIHDTASIDNVRRFLIKPGILKKPYLFAILTDLPGMGYMPNPRGMCEMLLLLVNRLKELDNECQILVCSSGRASIYLGTLAILLGLHLRVGTEDSIWRFPHKDIKINNNVEVFKQAYELCNLLGREVATADECRKILNIEE